MQVDFVLWTLSASISCYCYSHTFVFSHLLSPSHTPPVLTIILTTRHTHTPHMYLSSHPYIPPTQVAMSFVTSSSALPCITSKVLGRAKMNIPGSDFHISEHTKRPLRFQSSLIQSSVSPAITCTHMHHNMCTCVCMYVFASVHIICATYTHTHSLSLSHTHTQ